MASKGKALVAFLVASILYAPLAQAGCGVYFKKQVVAVAAVPVAVYQVGSDLEARAAAIKALRDYGIIAQDAKPVGEDKHVQSKQAPPAPEEATGDFRKVAPTLFAKCGSCHAFPEASAGSYFALSEGLDGDTFFRITDMVANKADVPAKMKNVINSIKPDEYGKILDEAIKLKKVKSGQTAKVTVSGFEY